MPPRTRRRAQLPQQSEQNEDGNTQDLVTQANLLLTNIKKMQDQLVELRQENDNLKDELESARGFSSSGTKSQLQRHILDLETAHRKDLRRIDRLRKKELEAEAKELEETNEQVPLSDSAYKMRKLLRKFHDLMLVATLADDGEDCAICLEKMQLNKCSSLNCEHQVCNNCLSGISKGEDETIQCPHCRQHTPREELELVYYTETNRWDALLAIAKAFSALDRRGTEDTSEEEAEEEFIDHDGQPDTSSRGESDATDGGKNIEDELPNNQETDVSDTSSPPPHSYQNSPTKVKRERMEELAAGRRKKARY